MATHTGHTGEVTVRFTTPRRDLSWLEGMPEVTRLARRDGLVEVTGRGPVLVDIAAALAAHGLRPADLRVEQPTLEDVFLEITGRRLEE
jgi:ABC-2 type transport system ATP-binding protein